MSHNAILAIAWLAFSGCLIGGFAYLIGWVDDRAEQRRAHRAAE